MTKSTVHLRYLIALLFSSLVICTHGLSSPNSAPPAYLVIEAKLKKSELQQFGKYAAKVQGLVARFGGEYLVLGGNHEPLEGDWGKTRMVLHKWPNATTAKEFWDSDEYQEVKKLREGTGEFRIMMLEGLEIDDVSP